MFWPPGFPCVSFLLGSFFSFPFLSTWTPICFISHVILAILSSEFTVHGSNSIKFKLSTIHLEYSRFNLKIIHVTHEHIAGLRLSFNHLRRIWIDNNWNANEFQIAYAHTHARIREKTFTVKYIKVMCAYKKNTIVYWEQRPLKFTWKLFE